MFRYHHLKNLPEIFDNFFIANHEIHDYNTRNASQLHKISKRTDYAKHTLMHKGIDVWNSLDNKYKNINSYNSFKKYIKNHLFQNGRNV